MKVDYSVLLIIIGCALVTLVPRIIPFIVVRKIKLPSPFLKWLSYIPVCLLTALIVQGVIQPTNTVPAINWLNLLVLVPTLLVAIRTKSLLATVLTGIAAAAFVRWIF